MAKVDLSPHKYREIKHGPGRGRKVVDYDNPKAYIRIANLEHGYLFIQNGRLMQPDGASIPHESTPDWALAEIKKQSPEALRAVGYNVREVLAELDAKAKGKAEQRKKDKSAIARRAALEKARAAKAKKREVMPDDEPVDPEPEDVGLDEEIEEDAAEEVIG